MAAIVPINNLADIILNAKSLLEAMKAEERVLNVIVNVYYYHFSGIYAHTDLLQLKRNEMDALDNLLSANNEAASPSPEMIINQLKRYQQFVSDNVAALPESGDYEKRTKEELQGKVDLLSRQIETYSSQVSVNPHAANNTLDKIKETMTREHAWSTQPSLPRYADSFYALQRQQLHRTIDELEIAQKAYQDSPKDPKTLEKALTVCTEKATACQAACTEALEKSQQINTHLNDIKHSCEKTIHRYRQNPKYFPDDTLTSHENKIRYLRAPITASEKTISAAKKTVEALSNSHICITKESRNNTTIDRTLARINETAAALATAQKMRIKVMNYDQLYLAQYRRQDFENERNRLNEHFISNKTLLATLPTGTEVHAVLVKRCEALENLIKNFPDNETLENASAHRADDPKIVAANRARIQPVLDQAEALLSEQATINEKVSAYQAMITAENSGPWQNFLSILSSH